MQWWVEVIIAYVVLYIPTFVALVYCWGTGNHKDWSDPSSLGGCSAAACLSFFVPLTTIAVLVLWVHPDNRYERQQKQISRRTQLAEMRARELVVAQRTDLRAIGTKVEKDQIPW
jgi:hypothetical protein